MPVELEMEAMPSDDQVNNILADLTRVFVIEIILQTTHASGVGITEEIEDLIKWSLPKSIMVKIMKIGHMLTATLNTTVAITRAWAQIYLNYDMIQVDQGIDGVLDEINTLFMYSVNAAAGSNLKSFPVERNWEPGKVLPKNELYYDIYTQMVGTEAATSIVAQVVHVHYQLFKFELADSDRMLWEKATTT